MEWTTFQICHTNRKNKRTQEAWQAIIIADKIIHSKTNDLYQHLIITANNSKLFTIYQAQYCIKSNTFTLHNNSWDYLYFTDNEIEVQRCEMNAPNHTAEIINLIKPPNWKFSTLILDSILSKLFIRETMREKFSKIKKKPTTLQKVTYHLQQYSCSSNILS